MAYNLLRCVQLILSSLDSDEVTSITDTIESQQIVDILEVTYNDLASTMDLPEHWDFFQLTETSSATPTLMSLPTNILQFDWLEYDNSTGTEKNNVRVSPLVRYELLRRMNTLDTADDTVFHYNYTVGSQDFDIRGRNNAFPQFFTPLGQRQLIFDNYNVTYDSYLKAAKTIGWGKHTNEFTRSDSFVIPFDEQNFSLFFNEAKSQAFLELKQVQNAKADQRARQAKIMTQLQNPPTPQYPNIYNTPNYGRHSNKPGGKW